MLTLEYSIQILAPPSPEGVAWLPWVYSYNLSPIYTTGFKLLFCSLDIFFIYLIKS